MAHRVVRHLDHRVARHERLADLDTFGWGLSEDAAGDGWVESEGLVNAAVQVLAFDEFEVVDLVLLVDGEQHELGAEFLLDLGVLSEVVEEVDEGGGRGVAAGYDDEARVSLDHREELFLVGAFVEVFDERVHDVGMFRLALSLHAVVQLLRAEADEFVIAG